MATALAVVPPAVPPQTSRTLFDIEEHLAALVETAELVSADQEQEFVAELRQSLATAVEKRDRVAQFLLHCESQAALADLEIKRLRERKAVFQRAHENMEAYVVKVIEGLGKDAKGKFRKLEGNTCTFAIGKCPDSVEITDEEQIPAEYKRLTVTLPTTAWETMLDALDLEDRARVLEQVTKAECDPLKTPIKEAIAAGTDVPGARLVRDRYSLRRS